MIVREIDNLKMIRDAMQLYHQDFLIRFTNHYVVRGYPDTPFDTNLKSIEKNIISLRGKIDQDIKRIEDEKTETE